MGLFLPLLDLDDARLVREPAPPGHLGHAAQEPVPIDHRPLAGGADDKARAPIQQGFQQILPIAAAVHGPDPTSPGVGADQIDGGQHLGVLAGEVLGLH